MAQLRHFQLFRSTNVYSTLADAKTALGTQLNDNTTLVDGEMMLARYYGTENTPKVHSILGIVRVKSGSKSMDYFYCGCEMTNKINALDVDEYSQASFANGILTVFKISETDGKIVKGAAENFDLGAYVDGKINALKVTGYKQAAIGENTIIISGIKEDKGKISADSTNDVTINVDGTVSSTNKLATQTTVTTAINALNNTGYKQASYDGNGNIVINGIKETNGIIAADDTKNTTINVNHTYATDATATDLATVKTVKDAIETLDVTAQTVVAMTSDKTKLQGATISETDGKIAAGSLTDLIEFNQALSSTNKAATMADVTAANLSGLDAINVNNTIHQVKLNIDSNDNILTQSTNGLLANITLEYDSTNKKIKLNGKENGTGKTLISEINATDFVKDGMITDVEVVETAEQGVTVEAPYLKITWNTDAAKDPSISRISLKKLVDVYTADETYLHMNDHKVEHKKSGVSTGSYGESATATKDYAGTISIPRITVDAAGHVTAASNSVITLPSKQTAKDEIKMNVEGNKATITNTFTLDNTAQAGTSVFVEADDGLKITEYDKTGAKISHSSTYQPSAEAAAVVVDEAGETTTFKIPSLTIDNYGHVTGKKDTPVTITLPESIDTAVQTVLGDRNTDDQRDNLENTKYINVKAVREGNSNDVKLQSSIKTIAIEEASAGTANGWRYIGKVGVIELKEGDIVESSKKDDIPNINFADITYTYGNGQNGTETGGSFAFGKIENTDLATVDGADKGELKYATKYIWMKGTDDNNTSAILATTPTLYQGCRIYRKFEETPENDGLATSLNVRNYINSHETQIIAGTNTTVTAAMDGGHTVYTINATGTPVTGGNGINVAPVSGNTEVSVDLAQNATSGSTRTHTQASNLLIIDGDNKLSISDTWDCGTF